MILEKFRSFGEFLKPRERIKATIHHKLPDRIPLDLGSMFETSIAKSTYVNLRNYLGLKQLKEIKVFDIIQQLPVLDEDFLKLLEVDVKGVFPEPSSSWNLDIKQEGGYSYFEDEWGIKWYMPLEGGFYYDARFHPMKDLTYEEIKKFKFPDFTDRARYRNLKAKALKVIDDDYALVSGTGVGIMLMCSWLRGMEQFFMDMASDKKLAGYLLDKVTEASCISWSELLKEIGDIMDIAYTGDDLANQLSPLVSNEMFDSLLKPRYRKIMDNIKASTDARISFHSCGNVYSLIPELIDLGVDILNPVQVSAKDMDTKKLKKEFGRDIVFWGGGCDTQKILPLGTVQEVAAEVKRRISDLAPGGGFIFNQVHNIQAGVPPENIMAMYDTLKEYWEY